MVGIWVGYNKIIFYLFINHVVKDTVQIKVIFFTTLLQPSTVRGGGIMLGLKYFSTKN